MLLRTSSAPVLSAACHAESIRDPDPPPFSPSLFPCRDPPRDPAKDHFSNCNSSSNGINCPSPLLHRHSSSSIDLHRCIPVEDSRLAVHSPWDMDLLPVNGGRLSRAQSEGELASLGKDSACRYAARSLLSTVTDDENQGAMESTRHSRVQQREPPCYLGMDLLVDREDWNGKEGEQMLEGSMQRDKLPPAFTDSEESKCSFSLNYDAKTMHGLRVNDGEVYTGLGVLADGEHVVCNAKGCRPLTQSERLKLGILGLASVSGSDDARGFNGGFKGRDDRGGIRTGSSDRDAYYQRLLQDEPGNPLLLRNYAQYLLEDKGDLEKSEEFYERAILACPGDGEVLSQYAKLQWDVRGDQSRAESYFDQAIQAAPDDCYVMGSYASFLWDVEEDESSPLRSPAYGGSLATSPVAASA